jgi:hypothetical protein
VKQRRKNKEKRAKGKLEKREVGSKELKVKY